jgi:hypothetical protein
MSKLYDVLEQIIDKVNKSVKIEEGQEFTDEEKRLVLTNLGLTDIAPKTIVEPEEDDIPKVFINGTIPTTKDEVSAEITYISKTLSFHAYIEIKCQGNSSMSYPKKNFTIKLFEDPEHTSKKKINFKGWGKQNKFCLKANWIDISHLRNIVSARLWGDIVESRSNYDTLPKLLKDSPNNGAIDGFPIKVYNNGIYQGRYSWNIPKDKWTFNMDDGLEEHCILCGENYDSGCFRAAALIDESDWTDEIHDTCPESIKTSWNNVIDFVMNSSDEDFKANIENYFDLQSLLDYHIYGLYMCGIDQYGKNQIYMTYDGIKWIASMYDMDSTWGLYWNGQTLLATDYGREQYEDQIQGRMGNLLYERIEQNFFAELLARWNELKASALAISNIINRFERLSDIASTELIKEDYASTTANGAYTGIPSVTKNSLQQIRNFAAARRSWTDTYLAALKPAERIPCTGLTFGVLSLFFDETSPNTQTVSVTLSPSNTTDKVIWKSNDESIVVVNKGNVTAKAIGNTTITATCGDITKTLYVYVTYIPEESDEGSIVYQLPVVTTFDGTNYIDTGVAPLAEDKPFTIFIDWTDTNECDFTASKYVIMHAMNENTPYPGMVVQYGPSGIISEYRQGSNSISSNSVGGLIENADLERARIVFRKDADGKITVARCYNNNGQIHKNEKTMDYVAVNEPLRLGCYRSNVGGTGRFAKGILNNCRIYDYALDDATMEELLIQGAEALPVATETKLRSNWRPQGGKWSDTVTGFDWNRGDYIEIKVNLSGCASTNENIISIGDNIANWNQNIGGYHAYYTPSDNRFEVNSLLSSSSDGRESAYPVNKAATILRIDKDGFHVDGNYVVRNGRINELSSFYVGSAEGQTRSSATYEYIKVVKYVTSAVNLEEEETE